MGSLERLTRLAVFSAEIRRYGELRLVCCCSLLELCIVSSSRGSNTSVSALQMHSGSTE